MEYPCGLNRNKKQAKQSKRENTERERERECTHVFNCIRVLMDYGIQSAGSVQWFVLSCCYILRLRVGSGLRYLGEVCCLYILVANNITVPCCMFKLINQHLTFL